MDEALILFLLIILIAGLIVGAPIAIARMHQAEAEANQAKAEVALAEGKADAERERARAESRATVVQAEAIAHATTSAAMLPWALAVGAFCGWPWVFCLIVWLLPRRDTHCHDSDIIEIWQAIRQLTRQINGVIA